MKQLPITEAAILYVEW